MWLGSQAAVAIVQAHSLSSDLTPSLGTSKCHRCSPQKTKKKKKKTNKKNWTAVTQVVMQLWHRFLEQELPYAMGRAIKNKKQKKKPPMLSTYILFRRDHNFLKNLKKLGRKGNA